MILAHSCAPRSRVLARCEWALRRSCYQAVGDRSGTLRRNAASARSILLASSIIAFARDQQNKVSEVCVVIGRKTQRRGLGKDFPAIIDVKRVGQLKAGPRCNERIQVEHGSAF